MRKFICTLLVTSLALTGAFAASVPPISITVKSYNALEAGAIKLINAVQPGEGEKTLAEIRGGLGLSQLQGVDKSRPWQAVLWLETVSNEPSVSVRVPVSNFNEFKQGLDDTGLFANESGANSLSEVDGYAVLWIEDGEPSAAVKGAHADWKPGNLTAPDHLLRLAITPGEPLRNELLGFVGMGRMMIGGALGQQGEEAIPGVDMKALTELLGVYFDVIQMGVGGLEQLAIGLNVADDAIILDEDISPKAGTELANWLKGGGESIAGVLPYADEASQAGFAMRFGNSEALLPTIKKFMRLSFQMQGAAADDAVIEETEKMIESMLPLQVAGSADFSDGLNFRGVYKFPGKDLSATYSMFMDFLKGPMQSQVGEEKPYKEVSVQTGVREVAGVNVDRVTLVMNLEAPIYQQPGQKEMVEMMWNGGAMVFEYAIKGDHMYIATEGEMDALLNGEGKSSTKPVLPVSDKTVVYGRLNLLELIPKFLAANPMMPPEMKEGFARLDATGTDVAFKVDLDGAFHSQSRVPLKFISTMGQFAAGQADGGE